MTLISNKQNSLLKIPFSVHTNIAIILGAIIIFLQESDYFVEYQNQIAISWLYLFNPFCKLTWISCLFLLGYQEQLDNLLLLAEGVELHHTFNTKERSGRKTLIQTHLKKWVYLKSSQDNNTVT